MHKKGRNEGNRENTRKALKTIFKLLGILMETGIWPAE